MGSKHHKTRENGVNKTHKNASFPRQSYWSLLLLHHLHVKFTIPSPSRLYPPCHLLHTWLHFEFPTPSNQVMPSLGWTHQLLPFQSQAFPLTFCFLFPSCLQFEFWKNNIYALTMTAQPLWFFFLGYTRIHYNCLDSSSIKMDSWIPGLLVT